jgi:hypothetical protein
MYRINSNLSAKGRSCSPYSTSDEIESSLDLNWKIIFVDVRKSTVLFLIYNNR